MDAPFPIGLMDEIDRILNRDSELPTGLDLYPHIFESGLMFPLQRQAELVKMIKLARTVEPQTVMEIGSDKAGGLYHWCKCLPTVTSVIASEIRGTPYADSFEIAFPDIEFQWIQGSSYDKKNVDKVASYLGKGSYGAGAFIDILFIDGDKSAFDVDFYAYLNLMNPKGIVFMHDITDDAPGRAFRSVVSKGYRHLEIIDKSDTYNSLERDRQGIPPANPHEGWLRHWKGQSCGVGVIFMPEYEGAI